MFFWLRASLVKFQEIMYLPSSRLYVKAVSADIELPENSSGIVKSPVTVNVHPVVCGMRNLRFLDNNFKSLFIDFLECVEDIGRIAFDITNIRK
jgi:hypothetical protein